MKNTGFASEAKQSRTTYQTLDCLSASPLAMTEVIAHRKGRWR